MSGVKTKKTAYRMTISRLTVDKLGVKLYDRISAVLAELVANSYDADATTVTITAPMDTLMATKHGKDIQDKGLEITVEDDGCGMSPEQVNEFYLRVGAERRQDPKRGDVSKKYERRVMGRKGVGKLAPFGVCHKVEIISAGGPKVEGENEKGKSTTGYCIANLSLSSYGIITDTDSEYEPDVEPLDGMVRGKRGTRLVLTDFNHRRVPAIKDLERQLAARFGLSSRNWKIVLRDSNKQSGDDGYELVVGSFQVDRMAESALRFQAPPKPNGVALGSVIDSSGTGRDDLSAGFDHEGDSYPVVGWVGYSKQPYKDDLMAGVRIYCRSKIAAQTKIFNMKAGFTGEHDVRSYLVGELHADWLDEDEDLIRTDRQDILWSSDLGQAFEVWGQKVVKSIGKLTREPMRKKGWEKFVEVSDILDIVASEYPADDLKDVRENCLKIAKLIAKTSRTDELNDEEHIETLVDLALLFGPHLTVDQQLEKAAGNAEQPIAVISSLLRTARIAELSSFGDIASKRVEVIEQLERHKDDPETLEAVLQRLLDSAPWLINPQWSPIVANQSFETLRKEFCKFYEKREGTKLVLEPVQDSNKRADFVMSSQDNTIQIIEIKRPHLKLPNEDFDRMVKYDQLMREFLDLSGNEEFKLAYPDYKITLVCDGLKLDNVRKLAMEALCKAGRLDHISWSSFLRRAKLSHQDFLNEATKQRRQTSKRVLAKK